jgi:hypothetical protein
VAKSESKAAMGNGVMQTLILYRSDGEKTSLMELSPEVFARLQAETFGTSAVRTVNS